MSTRPSLHRRPGEELLIAPIDQSSGWRVVVAYRKSGATPPRYLAAMDAHGAYYPITHVPGYAGPDDLAFRLSPVLGDLERRRLQQIDIWHVPFSDNPIGWIIGRPLVGRLQGKRRWSSWYAAWSYLGAVALLSWVFLRFIARMTDAFWFPICVPLLAFTMLFIVEVAGSIGDAAGRQRERQRETPFGYRWGPPGEGR